MELLSLRLFGDVKLLRGQTKEIATGHHQNANLRPLDCFEFARSKFLSSLCMSVMIDLHRQILKEFDHIMFQ